MEQNMLQLSLLILLIPFAGFLILIFFGKRLPRQGDWLGTSLLGVTLLMSVYLLITKISSMSGETLSHSFSWVIIGIPGSSGFSVDLGIMIDNLTVVMLVVVMLVSFLVHLFSIGYMKGDPRYSRYFSYLGLFTFSMTGIVLTNNLLMMYIFWELVGISSYLLIGFWYEKKSASNAANKAFIVNRIGDAGMFIGIMILFIHFSTFTFDAIFSGIQSGDLPFQSTGWLTAAGVLIFCGAVGKSAQFPLHVWLPDAMEGPTPVSALIHAATMVAAGVYLIARMFPILTAEALLIIAYTGAITALIAATIALTQHDIKKILAYSTISQLGYMVMALGVGAFTAGFMHLVTHAAFKAGLFLGAGSVIFAMHHALHKKHDHHTDAQDLRNMGGLKSRMPVTYWTFLIFTLAISGVPLTSGFLSKDEILAGTLAFSSLNGHYLLPVIGFLVAGLTAFYMFRLFILTFHGKHADETRTADLKESPFTMTIPLIILAGLSTFIFYSFNPIGASGGWFFNAIERPLSMVPEALQPAGAAVFANAVKALHTTALILSILIASAGIFGAFWVYQWKKISAESISSKFGVLYQGSFNKWYFDEMYQAVFVNGTFLITRILRWFDENIIDGIVNGAAYIFERFSVVNRWFDENIIDGLVNASASITGVFGKISRKTQTGKVQHYLVFVILGMLIFYFILI
jgi:NADH-quinone oxidoreductase subunit L